MMMICSVAGMNISDTGTQQVYDSGQPSGSLAVVVMMVMLSW